MFGADASSSMRVMLVTSEDQGWSLATQSALQSTGAFTAVDIFPADVSTPSLSYLQGYNAVLVWQCNLFASASKLGDVLAQYWDGGGAVVATGISSKCQQGNLQGRFGNATNGYMLIDWPSSGEWPSDSLGAVLEPQSPLMNGVSSLSGSEAFRSTGRVINGGVVVAQWASNGRPLVVRGTRAGRPLVILNMWPVPAVLPSFWVGDGGNLLRNALLYSTCAPCSAGTFAVAGATACTQCPQGTYSNAGSCLQVTSGTYSSSAASTTSSAAPTTSTAAPTTSTATPDAYSAGPYSVGASGLRVIQASFNLSAAAWVIDVAFSKSSPEAVAALFLPRAQAGQDGYYTAQFNGTFLPNGFPCSAADVSARAATACCLPDFVVRYHVAAAFAVADSSGAACASPYAAPPALIAADAVSGGFGGDMPSSWAAALPPAPGQPAWVSAVRITVGRADLRLQASRFSGQAGVSEALDSFVGLAQFVPVPGSRILDSSASQVALSLVKSDYFTVAASGAAAHTFLSYISVRVHEVLDAADPAQRSQYAAVSFALNADFQPNAATGLVPPTSVRVGVGASQATANWTSPCERAVSPQFAARLSQPCGPAVAMCAPSPAVSLTDRFASINAPLVTGAGGPLFDQAGGQTVFVELVVSAVDAAGRPATTTLSASVPVSQGGVGTWCFGAAASSRAEDFVEGVDLLVGSAGSPQDLARLQTLVGVPLGAAGGPLNATQSLGARSVESGLLTVVLRGKDTYFGRAEAAGAALEIEDLVSLHVTGDAAYAQVSAALAGGGGGFRIVADQAGGGASLAPSAALAALCAQSAAPLPSAGCLLRYDIRSRAAAPGLAYEVVPGQAAAAGAFMQGLVGGSDYAAALGANFSALLAAKYQLSASSRARRAFWVSPAVAYAPADAAGRARFALSQRVVVVALVHFVAPGGARRRALLSSAAGLSAGAAAVAAAEFGTGLGDAMAARLGLPADRVSLWRIGLRLTAEQACMSSAALASSARAVLLGALSEPGTASPVADVGIAAASVAPGGVACGRRSAPQAAAAAAGEFEAVIAFRAGPEPPALSAARLRLVAGILSVIAVAVPASVRVDDDAAAPPASSAAPAIADNAGGSSPGMIAGAVVAAVCAAMVTAACGVTLLRRKAVELEPYPACAAPDGGGEGDGEGDGEGGLPRLRQRRRTVDAEAAGPLPLAAVAAV